MRQVVRGKEGRVGVRQSMWALSARGRLWLFLSEVGAIKGSEQRRDRP